MPSLFDKFTLKILPNLRWRIFFIISALILTALLVIGMITYNYSVNVDKQDWKTRQEDVTRYVVSLMDSHMVNLYQYMDQITKLPSREDRLNSNYLKSILDNAPYFYELAFVSPEGKLLATAWLDSPMIGNSFTIPQSTWFVEAKAGKRYTSDLQILQNGQTYIIISQPTQDGDILVARVQAGFFQTIVDTVDFGETGKVMLLNEDRNIIAHSNYDYVINKRSLPETAYDDKYLQDSDNVYFGEQINYNGDEIYFAAKRLINNQWVVITTVDRKEVIQTSQKQLTAYLFGFLLIGFMITGIILLLLNKHVFVPLTSLQIGADRVTDGNYEKVVIDDTKDEFGRVAESFNRMVDRIQKRDDNLLEEIRNRGEIARELKTSQERYALVTRGSNDGIWDWNITEDVFYYSTRWKSLLGYDEHEIGTSPEEWFERIYPQEREMVQNKLNEYITGIAPGFNCDFRMRRKDGIYIWVRYRGLLEMDQNGKPVRMAGSQTDITQQKDYEEQLHFAAYHDSLTSLPNRKYLSDHIKEILLAIQDDHQQNFALLFLDLDRFKYINDTLGHMKGDQVLIKVAALLKKWIKPTDFICRFGGDEFIIILRNINNHKQIVKEIQTLHMRLNKPLLIDGKQIYIGVSVGVALGPGNYNSGEEMIRDADIALYQSKQSGLSHFKIFDPGMRQQTMNAFSIDADLRHALEKKELRLHYQPIVNLETMHLSGFEALVRWQHPQQGLLYPGSFIPLAEETGMIKHIGKWVLDEAIAQLSFWQKENPALTMSVNLSAKQLKDEFLVESILSALLFHEVPMHTFALEITETSVLEFDEFTLDILNQLKKTGIRLYLDDFGTGYSSLNVLHKYPIDTIKVDQTFIREILTDTHKGAITHSIIDLGKSLGMAIIAEGIENQEAMQLLKQFACPMGQGYYFNKPMAVEDIKLKEINQRLSGL